MGGILTTPPDRDSRLLHQSLIHLGILFKHGNYDACLAFIRSAPHVNQLPLLDEFIALTTSSNLLPTLATTLTGPIQTILSRELLRLTVQSRWRADKEDFDRQRARKRASERERSPEIEMRLVPEVDMQALEDVEMELPFHCMSPRFLVRMLPSPEGSAVDGEEGGGLGLGSGSAGLISPGVPLHGDAMADMTDLTTPHPVRSDPNPVPETPQPSSFYPAIPLPLGIHGTPLYPFSPSRPPSDSRLHRYPSPPLYDTGYETPPPSPSITPRSGLLSAAHSDDNEGEIATPAFLPALTETLARTAQVSDESDEDDEEEEDGDDDDATSDDTYDSEMDDAKESLSEESDEAEDEVFQSPVGTSPKGSGDGRSEVGSPTATRADSADDSVTGKDTSVADTHDGITMDIEGPDVEEDEEISSKVSNHGEGMQETGTDIFEGGNVPATPMRERSSAPSPPSLIARITNWFRSPKPSHQTPTTSSPNPTSTPHPPAHRDKPKKSKIPSLFESDEFFFLNNLFTKTSADKTSSPETIFNDGYHLELLYNDHIVNDFTPKKKKKGSAVVRTPLGTVVEASPQGIGLRTRSARRGGVNTSVMGSGKRKADVAVTPLPVSAKRSRKSTGRLMATAVSQRRPSRATSTNSPSHSPSPIPPTAGAPHPRQSQRSAAREAFKDLNGADFMASIATRKRKTEDKDETYKPTKSPSRRHGTPKRVRGMVQAMELLDE